MQSEQAASLRRSWGDKPCDHPGFSKEYYLSAQTGDYICGQCGNCFTREEVEQIKLRRKNDLSRKESPNL